MPKTRSAAARTPRFESLAFQVDVEGRPAQARAAARRALEMAFAAGADAWDLRPLNRPAREFEAVPRQPKGLAPGRAWDLAYRLHAVPDVVYAEPLFEIED